MAGTKMPAVALLILAMLVASSTVIPTTEASCFQDCYKSCNAGKLACTSMCNDACVLGDENPDADVLAAGLGK